MNCDSSAENNVVWWKMEIGLLASGGDVDYDNIFILY